VKLTYCVECGTLCVENPTGLCPNCIREEEAAEDRVSEFLKEHKRASLDDIHNATGVKHKVILRMIKRGRIMTDAIITYPCETCGQPISAGRVCDDCNKNIISQLKKEEWQPQQDQRSESSKNERMYINDLLKKK